MINIPELITGTTMLFSEPVIFFVIPLGLVIGLIAGAMPGISNTMAMAIVLPLTLYMDFMPAVMLLTSIFTGAGFGVAIPAILMGVPGAPPAVATTFDGYPMAKQGMHNEALGIGLMSSCIGALGSYVVLLFLVVPLAQAVRGIGPVEMLVIALWGLTMIASLGGNSVARGIIAGILGLLCGTIGMSTSGYTRDFGINALLDGIPVVPAMMGLLAASQLFMLIGKDFLVSDEALRKGSTRKVVAGMGRALRSKKALLRGSIIGAVIGAVPGVGTSISNLISYGLQKRSDPNATVKYGEGNPNGIVAGESSNSSGEGGGMVTMLALGIPGGGGTAMLLVAFLMHNVVPGPKLLRNNMDLVYMFIVGNFVQVFLLFFIGLLFLTIAGNIVRVPIRILIPTVLVFAIFGAFAVTGNWVGPMTLFVFSALGYIMKRYDFSVAACVIGIILGRLVENELIRSWQLTRGEFKYIIQHPVAIVFGILLILSLVWPVISPVIKRYFSLDFTK